VKIRKKQILDLSLALLLSLFSTGVLINNANADEDLPNNAQNQPVQPKREGVWYKFETPLITLLFPAGGKKPILIWWYTNDSSQVYVLKFKGVIEYLTFDVPHYVRRHHADGPRIMERLEERFIGPKMGRMHSQLRQRIMERMKYMRQHVIGVYGLHPAFLPFSGGSWELEPPELVTKGNVSYWSFNFTLKNVPMPKFKFAEGNIQIRCRFYTTNATEIIDEDHSYTVAAGQLKFDFIVKNWEWNIDKLKPFLEELKEKYEINVPPHKTGLALWVNLASIRIEDLSQAEGELQNTNNVESMSQMQGAMVNNEYCPVNENKTANQDEDERPFQLTNRFRKHFRIRFARKERTLAGFLEFVPWARLLDENGSTVDYVNVTASYIAAGGHLRLFLCYPYFGNYTLEHDPTIGLASAPPIPQLVTPELLLILIGATIAIVVAVAAIKLRKKIVNVVS
jgi:hypothetical protein